MNKKGQELNVLGYALVFLVMFFIGELLVYFHYRNFLEDFS